jgi:hypothetical protein
MPVAPTATDIEALAPVVGTANEMVVHTDAAPTAITLDRGSPGRSILGSLWQLYDLNARAESTRPRLARPRQQPTGQPLGPLPASLDTIDAALAPWLGRDGGTLAVDIACVLDGSTYLCEGAATAVWHRVWTSPRATTNAIALIAVPGRYETWQGEGAYRAAVLEGGAVIALLAVAGVVAADDLLVDARGAGVDLDWCRFLVRRDRPLLAVRHCQTTERS